jgi:hypothetical protein
MGTILRPWNSALMTFGYFGVEVSRSEGVRRRPRYRVRRSLSRTGGWAATVLYNFRGTREVLDVGQAGNKSRGRAVSA